MTVIDLAGMFVMPGIIDTHCHFAISGGVNEFSLSVVPEVRVRDVINSEDVQIYRALAGGVTTARLLHGSANVIGGQDAVIKLKYGQSGRELLVAERPARRQVRPGRERQAHRRPIPQHPPRRRGGAGPRLHRGAEYRKKQDAYEKASRRGQSRSSSRAATCGWRRWPTCCRAT